MTRDSAGGSDEEAATTVPEVRTSAIASAVEHPASDAAGAHL